LANSKGIGCGGLIVILIVVAIVSSWFRGGDSDSTPESTIQPPSQSSSSIACEAALNGNERFVEVINGIQNNEMSTEVAAELSGEIEKSLDDAWETIDDPSFQSAMLEMANIIGIARMSLENGDLESYELMVDEFIVSGGYFRPYCE
jgi:hypothetical protein